MVFAQFTMFLEHLQHAPVSMFLLVSIEHVTSANLVCFLFCVG